MAEWIASWFITKDGNTWCRVCGCMVHPEWAGDHYQSLHGFKGF